jgi:hypothetical protein
MIISDDKLIHLNDDDERFRFIMSQSPEPRLITETKESRSENYREI